MYKTGIVILYLIFPIYLFCQNDKYAISENGKYFGYCSKVSKKEINTASNNYGNKNTYEFKYYNIHSKEPILTHRFFHSSKTPIEINISYNGNSVAITENMKTIVINAISKTIVAELTGKYKIIFPRYNDYFLRYSYNEKRKKVTLSAYDIFTGSFLRTYKSSNFSKGYGGVWISDDDKYMIQQKSFNKYNIWLTTNKTKSKSVTASSCKMDYYNNKVTFFKGSRSYTFSLANLKQLTRSDLKLVKRNFIKDRKAQNKKSRIKFLDEIASNSGNFLIIPFIENNTQSLLLSSTQTKRTIEIPTNNLELINNIKWLNDSVIILNHQNNTITLLNLMDNMDKKNIDLGLSEKRYIQNTGFNLSPDYSCFLKSKKNILINNLLIGNTNSPYKTHKLENHDFIAYTSDNKYVLVRNSKTRKYGTVKLSHVNYGLDVQYFMDSVSVLNELEILEDAEIPADYKPYRIKDFKHISELKDTSAIINLVLKNLEFSDSIVSLNTHLIDDDGVYYYGASDEKWKHIWCNLILKSQNDPARQITDFEIIEHRENLQTPNSTSIVMDHSGSMGNSRAEKLQLAVEKFIKTKSNEDEISLIKFDDKIGLESYPEKNKNILLKNLNKDGLGIYGGGTSILDAVNASVSILKNTKGVLKKSVCILTDGQENSSFTNHNVVVQRAIDNNVNVYTIGYGKNVDKDYLKSLSLPTNGSYYQIYRSNDFEWIFNDINSKVRNYYEIRFKSNNIGDHKAILKVCINDGQNDTLAMDFDNSPLDISYYNEKDVNYINYDQGNSFDQAEIMEDIPNIKDFSKIKSKTNLSTLDTETVKEDSINKIIQYEFDNINFPNIVFNFDKTGIVSSSLDGIDDVYDFLNKHPDVIIEISGHTDHVGADEYNLNLSEKRADKVKIILINMGIDEHRISTVGYGENSPIVSNSNEKNKQKNRRVDFRILNF